ncbi:hypothetical protein C453_06818 [Haloferax elongans ATCC BAA-1513]|uniref:Uncharacterized protein n=1 Tax=Haloferax elongans ATCC BAA-1513 TaxID=1230453 RepID=M0HP97_HALEO|nr:hypothetical protein [Haloferax elongans]ELZ85507.1 hypothetical protein C453_06818 [Haloferax elongans ATCC BAA-1513]
MPSTNDIERPQEALAVAQRYYRRERLLSFLVVSLVTSLFLGSYLLTSLLPAVVVVAALLVVVARAPILQSYGTVRLRTDDAPEAVVNEFASPTPPMLALQWGVADEVTTGDGDVTYPISYLFGLRTAEMALQTQTEPTPDGAHRVTVEITMNDQPWATYVATIEGNDGANGSDANGSTDNSNGQTTVDIEYTSNRRFGLRRFPQQFFTERYRDEALSVQGYTVVGRDSHFGL